MNLMNRRNFLFTGLFFLFFGQIFCQEQNNFLKDEIYAELKEKGSIKHLIQSKDGFELSLTPDTEFCKRAANTWNLSENPNLVSENLFLISKEELKELYEKMKKTIGDLIS